MYKNARISSVFAAVAFLCAATVSVAQEAEPGWAKGRPKTDVAMKMAPVPAFPIPTAAEDLPTKKFKLPPGFKVETWASGVLDARALREGAKGNVFVSTLFVANKVYVVPEKAVNGKREPKVIIDKTEQATGIEFHKGSLFFATNKKIVRYDNVEDKLDNLGDPSAVLTDKLPGGSSAARLPSGSLSLAWCGAVLPNWPTRSDPGCSASAAWRKAASPAGLAAASRPSANACRLFCTATPFRRMARCNAAKPTGTSPRCQP